MTSEVGAFEASKPSKRQEELFMAAVGCSETNFQQDIRSSDQCIWCVWATDGLLQLLRGLQSESLQNLPQKGEPSIVIRWGQVNVVQPCSTSPHLSQDVTIAVCVLTLLNVYGSKNFCPLFCFKPAFWQNDGWTSELVWCAAMILCVALHVGSLRCSVATDHLLIWRSAERLCVFVELSFWCCHKKVNPGLWWSVYICQTLSASKKKQVNTYTNHSGVIVQLFLLNMNTCILFSFCFELILQKDVRGEAT